jgi:4'-phosphopantetheinyl transferase
MNQIMNIRNSACRIQPSLRLLDDEVQLWRIDLEAIRENEAQWQKILSRDESARASRYHFARDRQRFVAARAWLRIILASYLETEPSRIEFSYSDKEKPSLSPKFSESGITFNISHSGGIGLLGFARRREIGVDVEEIRHNSDLEAIARRFFSAREQEELAAIPKDAKADAFFRCWTRKEAYIKATGDGLSLPLSQFDVSLNPDDNDALAATRPDPGEAEKWLLRGVPAGVGYAAAICVRGRNWELKLWQD